MNAITVLVVLIVAFIIVSAAVAVGVMLKDHDIARRFRNVPMFTFADVYTGCTKTPTACHVCGRVNIRRHWSEAGIGIVEEYYYCEMCGYFSEMAYSPVHEGLNVLKFPDCIRQPFIWIRNWKKLRGLKVGRPHF